MRFGRYAVIDIGTVTCRMLVADVTARGINELVRKCTICNLGEGVDASGVLSNDAMARVVQTIKEYSAIRDAYSTDEHPILKTVVVATSAARDAKNSALFISRLADVGVEVSVIPGEREAELSFLGASRDFLGERLLVVDIGGGSSELALGEGGANSQAIHSFDIGCRRVTERFFTSDPPTLQEISCAQTWICQEMSSWVELARMRGFLPARVVAVAGTATTVVSVRDHMEIYDAQRVHKAQVNLDELDEVRKRLASVGLEERKQIVGLEPGRAPVIVAGLLILRCVLSLVGATHFTVSESDILHGLILNAVR